MKAQKNHQSAFQLKKLAVTDIPSLEAEYRKVAQAKAPVLPPINGEVHYYVAMNRENQDLKTRAEIEAHKADETLLIWLEGWANWRTYDQAFGNE